MNGDFSRIGPFLLAALVVFVVYRRFRRNFGEQPLHPVRMRVRSVVLLLIGCFLLPTALRSAAFATALLGGAAAGVALALWGAARTRFVRIADQLHYVPHTYTGVAVSLLFLGRLVYRLIQVYGNTHTTEGHGLASGSQAFAPANMMQSPLTVSLFFVLVGYYVCYYSVVLRKAKREGAAEVSGPTPLPGELEKRA
jgi:hypothetical protein